MEHVIHMLFPNNLRQLCLPNTLAANYSSFEKPLDMYRTSNTEWQQFSGTDGRLNNETCKAQSLQYSYRCKCIVQHPDCSLSHCGYHADPLSIWVSPYWERLVQSNLNRFLTKMHHTKSKMNQRRSRIQEHRVSALKMYRCAKRSWKTAGCCLQQAILFEIKQS